MWIIRRQSFTQLIQNGQRHRTKSRSDAIPFKWGRLRTGLVSYSNYDESTITKSRDEFNTRFHAKLPIRFFFHLSFRLNFEQLNLMDWRRLDAANHSCSQKQYHSVIVFVINHFWPVRAPLVIHFISRENLFVPGCVFNEIPLWLQDTHISRNYSLRKASKPMILSEPMIVRIWCARKRTTFVESSFSEITRFSQWFFIQ